MELMLQQLIELNKTLIDAVNGVAQRMDRLERIEELLQEI